MSYRTDMVEEILTSEEGKRIMQMLSPIYGHSYVGLWMLQIIGMQLDKMSNWTAEAALQVTPQTATWTLDFWEQEYGIVPNASWTVEERRQNLMANMKFVAPMNPSKLEEIASTVSGVPVDVIENTGKNTFTVLVRQYTDAYDRIKEVIDRAKPAHLIYVIKIAYLVLAEIKVYTGIGVSTCERFKLKVVQ